VDNPINQVEEHSYGNNKNSLKFTGNWFIDAGILGFINLMGEVYGWDLKKLQNEITQNHIAVYFGYFPFAYFYKWLSERNKNVDQSLMNNFLEYLEKNKKLLKDNDDNQLFKQFDNIWNQYIKKLFNDKSNNRLPIDDSFYKNFLFFNNSFDGDRQELSFYNTISFNSDLEKELKTIDKSINKFLPSEEEFSNINYTKFFTEPFKKQFPYFFVYLLCFKYAFEYYKGIGHIFFYSNDLEFTYEINKKLRIYNKLYKHNKQNKDNEKNLILKITWQQIIDTLVEYKSSWSLENMYIISYQNLVKQQIEDVEYIGIPKLQASIILDDTIRDALNKYIQYRNLNSSNKNSVWLIKKFIEGEPLYPIILNHVELVLNEEKLNLESSELLYALVIEANILNFKFKNKKELLFSDKYLENYKILIDDIKKDIRFTSFIVSLIQQVFKDKETKKRIARELVEALKAKDKNMFLYILFKNTNKEKEIWSNHNINEWMFNRIIKNDISFEMYGLILTIYLLRGEKDARE
jgi:hypothetical protein